MTSTAMQAWLARRDKERRSIRLKIHSNSTPQQRDLVVETHLQTDYSKCAGVIKLGAKHVRPVVIESVMMVETEFGNLTIEETYGEVEILTDDELELRRAEVRNSWPEGMRETRCVVKTQQWQLPQSNDTFPTHRKKLGGG